MSSNFNDVPPNFREITEKEFAQSKFFVYSPERWEYRQITRKEDLERLQRKSALVIRMAHFYDGTGIAIESDYWAGKVHYFWFGACEHKERTQRNIGNCLNEYTCKNCGFVETLDSSG